VKLSDESKVEQESNSREQVFRHIVISFVLVVTIGEANFIARCISTKHNKA
jgi:hypothetical protein